MASSFVLLLSSISFAHHTQPVEEALAPDKQQRPVACGKPCPFDACTRKFIDIYAPDCASKQSSLGVPSSEYVMTKDGWKLVYVSMDGTSQWAKSGAPHPRTLNFEQTKAAIIGSLNKTPEIQPLPSTAPESKPSEHTLSGNAQTQHALSQPVALPEPQVTACSAPMAAMTDLDSDIRLNPLRCIGLAYTAHDCNESSKSIINEINQYDSTGLTKSYYIEHFEFKETDDPDTGLHRCYATLNNESNSALNYTLLSSLMRRVKEESPLNKETLDLQPFCDSNDDYVLASNNAGAVFDVPPNASSSSNKYKKALVSNNAFYVNPPYDFNCQQFDQIKNRQDPLMNNKDFCRDSRWPRKIVKLQDQDGTWIDKRIFKSKYDEMSAQIRRLQKEVDDLNRLPARTKIQQNIISSNRSRIKSLTEVRASLGSRGKNVRIVYADTGIMRVPEIGSNVRCEEGKNYMEEGQSPCPNTMPVASASVLHPHAVVERPSHGTEAASTITSPPGEQLSNHAVGNKKDNVTLEGSATDAHVIPVRVGNGVVHVFDYSNLSKALNEAADHNSKVSNAKDMNRVFWMTRGGFWRDRQLHDSLIKAREQGMIVVAAAGNNFQVPAYPGSDPNVISAGSVGIDMARWPGSAHGPEVKISAPGYYVLAAKAQTKKDANGKEFYDSSLAGTENSSGTTYASANMAGIIADWLSLHGDEISKVYPKYLNQELFLYLLYKGDIVTPLPGSAGLGKGVIDAEKLFKAPLPKPEEVLNFALTRPDQDEGFKRWLRNEGDKQHKTPSPKIAAQERAAGDKQWNDFNTQQNLRLLAAIGAPGITAVHGISKGAIDDVMHAVDEAQRAVLWNLGNLLTPLGSTSPTTAQEQMRRQKVLMSLMESNGDDIVNLVSAMPSIRSYLSGDFSQIAAQSGCGPKEVTRLMKERFWGQMGEPLQQAILTANTSIK